MPESSTSLSFLRLPEVRKRVGFSRATIYCLMAQGKFPRAVALGPRAVAWLDSEVTEWINDRVSASRRGTARTEVQQ
jgi:prophage regulatory protein